ncbi:hypothetical protein RJ641_024303 [Dillenia turbinata]|uniref:Uncharacterized protein n=1 Tax=Dillenia turbinata TaxID=194707 RepID=A0AAN8YTN8_9MAGN
MSSILGSQGVVVATAIALSGTILLYKISKNFPNSPFLENHNSHPSNQALRSCLCSDQRKKEKKKKKVQFAKNVKDPIGNSEEFRKIQRKSARIQRKCGNEIPGNHGMPENRVALYNGILRDRIHRTGYSS